MNLEDFGELLHRNYNYSVRRVPPDVHEYDSEYEGGFTNSEGRWVRVNFGVVNEKQGTLEYTCETYVQALIACEQFNKCLIDKLYLPREQEDHESLTDMLKDLVTVTSEDDDDEGTLQ